MQKTKLQNQNLPKGWKKVKLGEIVVKGGSVSGPFGSNISSKYFTKKGVPVIRGNNLSIGINGGRYKDSNYIFISEAKAQELSKSEAMPEDIIITARGTIGQTGIIPKNPKYKRYILSANQLRFRIDKTKADPLFIYYQLSSNKMVKTMQNINISVGVPNLNLTTTRKLSLVLPPLDEQHRIASILSAFDDKIELNNKINKTLEEMAQAIFKEWFVNFKFPGHEKTKFVNSELGRIPGGWKVKNIMEIIKRLPVGKKYSNKTALLKGKVPILDQGESGIIGYHNEEPSVVASVNDPVIVFSNHTCYYRLITYNFSCIQNIIPYIGINGYPTLFVYYLTKNKIKMSDYKGHWPEFAAQKFTIPPQELAIKFAEIIQPFVAIISKSQKENQKLAELRDLLLPKLMSGEIRV